VHAGSGDWRQFVRYRRYGNTGVEVSVLGFGCMRFPEENGHFSRNKTIPMIHRAIELGVNHFDTARGYGESEEVLGAALKGRRDKVYVTTKSPYKGASGDEWQKVLDTSLEKLDMDYIDFYLYHFLKLDDFEKGLKDEPLRRALKAKEEGIIKHLGFSSHDTPENIIKLIDAGPFECMTVQYNFLNRANEKAIDYAERKGLGITIMGPLGGGRLTESSAIAADGFSDKKWATAEIGLKYVFSNKKISNALSGMNELSQLEQNARVAGQEIYLTGKDKKKIHALLKKYGKLADLYCTGCKYCMPCPSEVNIPRIFRQYNYYRVYGIKEQMQEEYSWYGKKDYKWVKEDASACIECGQCEEKCPQNIEVRKQLKEAHGALSKKTRAAKVKK
jgi:predicted aldo/keto reductase-like oxidoreductase